MGINSIQFVASSVPISAKMGSRKAQSCSQYPHPNAQQGPRGGSDPEIVHWGRAGGTKLEVDPENEWNAKH
jgi:hypothetical protein